MDVRILKEAVERYNRYRSPEATARLIEVRDEEFMVEFSGSFCKTCGIYDWVEDLAYELNELYPEIVAEIANWRQASEDRVIAEFRLKKNSE